MADPLPMFAPDALDARITTPRLPGPSRRPLRRADAERWVERLHDRDGTLWSEDPEVPGQDRESPGLARRPRDFGDQVPALEAFGEGIRTAGFTAAIVAGWAAAAWPRTCSPTPSATSPAG